MVGTAEANQASWLTATAVATGGEAWSDGPLEWAWRPHDRELLLLFPPAVPPDALERGLAGAAARGARMVGCWGGPHTDEATLLAAGFERGWEPHWMAAALAQLPLEETDPRVAVTTDVPEYDGYGRGLLSLTAGGMTWHALARVDGAFAGHAWAHEAAGVAGLYDVEVVPAQRRRGLGRALTLAVCRAVGCSVATLNATPDGERLYGALGFQSLARGRTWWLRAGTAGLPRV